MLLRALAMRLLANRINPVLKVRLLDFERMRGTRVQAAVRSVPVARPCLASSTPPPPCWQIDGLFQPAHRHLHTTLAASGTVPAGQGAPEFLAPRSVTFASLGLSTDLVEALSRAGYEHPAHVQSITVPTALRGDDLLLAAETGSGKTLAYLLPLIQSLKQRQEWLAEDRPDAPGWFRHCAVVLCPNMELCRQVVSAAAQLTTSTGEPLARCALVSAKDPPGAEPIDIVVSTPAALVNLLQEFGEAYGKEWAPEAMSQRVRHLVADEADMLVSNPTFWEPLLKFLDLLRTGERAFAARAVSSITGITVQEFSELKRHIRMAAFEGGVSAMLAAGWVPPEGASCEQTDTQLRTVPRDIWVGAPHRCRSHLFVAATVPREGGKSVAADLRKRFPGMQWLQGRQLHFANANVQHTWIKLQRADEIGPTIIATLERDRAVTERIGHVLIFCQDVKSATALHGLLASVGLPVLLYHKKVRPEDRRQALERMKVEEGWIMVSTDAAARGLDFANINHVMQADFAENAADFLHRIGRTGRAGRTGQVTSLYLEDRAQLAEAIRGAVEGGESVEGIFSRNRSFSHKYKRYGKFVPRGQQG